VRRVLRHIVDARAPAVTRALASRDSDAARSSYPQPGRDVHVHCSRDLESTPARCMHDSPLFSRTEAVVVLPERSWEQAGPRLRRHFTVVRRYPAGTSLFTTPDHRAVDAVTDETADSQYIDEATTTADAPHRWSPRLTRFPTVVVVTAGLRHTGIDHGVPHGETRPL
jgi:hypothetical protein